MPPEMEASAPLREMVLDPHIASAIFCLILALIIVVFVALHELGERQR